MSQNANDPGPHSLLLDQLLAEYNRRRDSGEQVDIEQFCQSHPDLALALRSYVQGEKLLEALGETPDVSEIESEVSRIDETLRPVTTQRVDLTPNSMFGRYRILKLLGEGAMGSISLAEDTNLGRQVALKIPKFTGVEDHDFQLRFTREARAAARLDHPNVCRVYDAGEINGVPFITMEYITGQPLSRLVGSEEFRNQRRVADVIRQIASGLEHAHEQGILHRDLKPGNVLMKKGVIPCVTDFGLARWVNTEQESRLTHEGTILGTPAYMSPEQIEAKIDRIGPGTDIYALGVMLYELLTGRLPFQGSVMSILAQVLRDQPEPLEIIREDVAEPLAELCLEMLEKQPEHRPASMQEVDDRLQNWLGTNPTLVEEFPNRTHHSTTQERGLILNEFPTTVLDQPNAQSEFPSVPPQEKSAVENKSASSRWLVWLTLCGLLFGGMACGIVIYLKRGEQTLAVEIDEHWLQQQGGRLTLDVDGKEHSLSSPELDLKISVGEHGFSVRNGGMTIHNPEKFLIEKDGRQILSIDQSGMNLAGKHNTQMATRASENQKTSPQPVLTEPEREPVWQPTAEQQAFFEDVAKLPAEQQAAAVWERMRQINPGLEAEATFHSELAEGKVIGFHFQSDAPTIDIWPVRALVHLNTIMGRKRTGDYPEWLDQPKTGMFDLSPLAGLSLKALKCVGSKVRDLQPLKGMPLEFLDIGITDVNDVSALKDMPLLYLAMGHTNVTDVTPLSSMKLTSLFVGGNPIRDLSPLKGIPLQTLYCNTLEISDLSFLEGMPLSTLDFGNTPVTDLSPLKRLPIKHLQLPRSAIADLSPLEGMPLEKLSAPVRMFYEPDEAVLRSLPLQTLNAYTPAEEFWKKQAVQKTEALQFAEQTSQLPVQEQVAAVIEKLKQLNDNKIGEVKFEEKDGKVVGAKLLLFGKDSYYEPYCTRNLTPLLAFPSLKKITLIGGPNWLDLSVLKLLPIEELSCGEKIAFRNAPALQQVKTLQNINGHSADIFWRNLQHTLSLEN